MHRDLASFNLSVESSRNERTCSIVRAVFPVRLIVLAGRQVIRMPQSINPALLFKFNVSTRHFLQQFFRDSIFRLPRFDVITIFIPPKCHAGSPTER